MELKKLSNYTDEEIEELVAIYQEEQENRKVKAKKIKKLEEDYKKLLELFPDTHFYVTMKGEYDTFKADVLDLLDSYFKGDDFEY